MQRLAEVAAAANAQAAAAAAAQAAKVALNRSVQSNNNSLTLLV